MKFIINIFPTIVFPSMLSVFKLLKHILGETNQSSAQNYGKKEKNNMKLKLHLDLSLDDVS